MIVEQPRPRDGGEHIVAIDHVVVIDRCVRRTAIGLAMVEDRELADILLMRNLALRRQACQHREQARFHRRRLQSGHQETDRHQRVAPEIGVEPPRSGQEFFGIAEEGERVARPLIGLRRGVEQLCPAARGQRRLTGQCRHGEAYPPALARQDRAVLDPAIGDRHRQVVTRRAVQPVARPADHVRRHPRRSQHFGGGGAERLEIPDDPDARQHGLARHQPSRVDRHGEAHAVERAPLGVA